MYKIQIIMAGLAALLFAAAPRAGLALSSEWDANQHVQTRIVSAIEAAGERDAIPLGLHFKLQPGWKIYWRSPGDAGFPPDPDWSGSKNLRAAQLSWPAPERFSIFGLETLGYKDEVLLPLTVTPERPGEAVSVNALVRYLACKDICIPYKAKLLLDLPAGDARPGPHTNLIDSYVARVPGPGRRHGLSISRAVLLEGTEAPVIQIEARSTEPFIAPDLFVEGPIGVVFGKPMVTLGDNGRRAMIQVAGVGAEPATLDGGRLVFTLVDGRRAMEAVVPVAFSGPLEVLPPPSEAAAAALWRIVAWAILGGLILNLMPCVLPVLSIKLLSVVQYGGRDAAGVRIGFIATAAGVVASMLLIAAALVAIKSAGLSVGWGIQFQQPLFLVFMAVVVVLFACNLFGLFEIKLPQGVADVGLDAGGQPTIGGHFVTGAFATLLATPCSAPFVGTAVGFALSRGPVEIFVVFAALGLGLGLPYLAVAAFPRLATALPRPGRWMVVLRRVLGLALVATAVWLLSVIAAQIGAENAFILAAMLALIGAVLTIRRLPGSRLGRNAGKAVIVLSLAAFALPIVREPAAVEASTPAHWRPFDRAEIARVVAAGGAVFVDVTADWCISCLVNKKIVLDQGRVAAWLRGGKVVAMQADWTLPNPDIAEYLAGFGRYGIPFNAIYGPKAPRGIVLPEILTSAAVLDTAAEAGSDTRVVAR